MPSVSFTKAELEHAMNALQHRVDQDSEHLQTLARWEADPPFWAIGLPPGYWPNRRAEVLDTIGEMERAVEKMANAMEIRGVVVKLSVSPSSPDSIPTNDETYARLLARSFAFSDVLTSDPHDPSTLLVRSSRDQNRSWRVRQIGWTADWVCECEGFAHRGICRHSVRADYEAKSFARNVIRRSTLQENTF
jgi:hypothetical protein